MEKINSLHLYSKSILMRLTLLTFIALIAFSACNEKDAQTLDTTSSFRNDKTKMGASYSVVTGGEASEMAIPPAPTPASRVETTESTKIIYTADIKMQVDKLLDASQKLKKLVADSKAYLASDNQRQNDYDLTRSFIIRVPAEQFDTLLNQLVNEGVFLDYKNVRAEDVTSQYVDVATRLKNKQALEQQYLTILKQATKVADILEVQTQLAQVREDVDAQMAQLKLLQDQVSYSTINIELYQKLEFKARPKESFFAQLAESLRNGAVNFNYFVLHIASLWPFAILIGAIIFLVKWRKRKKK